MTKNSNLQLKQAEEGLFDHFYVQGDIQNKALFYIDSLRYYFANIDTAFSSIDYKRMVQEEQAETLLAFADTCQQIVPARYATYHADWGANRREIQQARTRLAGRFSVHPYLQEGYRDREEGKFRFSFWIVAILLLLLTGGFLLVVRQRPPACLQELSMQERKILGYLYEGKSNKEIASQLHIELSTVKSHVYSIYQKLSISSRKEVGRFRRWIES